MTPFAELEITVTNTTGNPQTDRYSVEVQFTHPGSDAPAGYVRLTLPFPLEELEKFHNDPDYHPASDAERDEQQKVSNIEREPDISKADVYGRLLCKTLLGDAEFKKRYDAAWDSAVTKETSLRVRLAIDSASPRLHRLHWEKMADPRGEGYLLEQPKVLFSRYISTNNGTPITPRDRTQMKALVCIAAPAGLPGFARVPVDKERELAKRALGWKERNQGLIHIDFLTNANLPETFVSLDNIAARLQKTQYDILYLVCHGKIENGESHVFLENALTALAERVSGKDVVRRLTAGNRPLLVVLSACQSGGTDTPLRSIDGGAGKQEQEGERDGKTDSASRSVDNGALALLGPQLAEKGIGAVVAMQGNVTIETAQEFMSRFFAQLVADGYIDRAAAVARTFVMKSPDFWAPVLFLRMRRGSLWKTEDVVPDNQEDIPFVKLRAVITAIRQPKNPLVPIIGPELSEPVFGSMQQIASALAQEHHFPLAEQSRDDLPQVAQFLSVTQTPENAREELLSSLRAELVRRHGDWLATQPRTDVNRSALTHLVKMVGGHLYDLQPPDAHRVLARCELPLYLTTSPFHLMEKALGKALESVDGEPVSRYCHWRTKDAYGNPLESALLETVAKPDAQHPLVYHLFGSMDDEEQIVLTEDDYFDFLISTSQTTERVPDFIRRALTDSSLLFVGFQITDWKFRVLLHYISNLPGRRKRLNVAMQINPATAGFRDVQKACHYLQSRFEKIDITICWKSAERFLHDLDAELNNQAGGGD